MMSLAFHGGGVSRAGIYQPRKNGERDVQPWNEGRAAAGNGLRMLTLQRFRSP